MSYVITDPARDVVERVTSRSEAVKVLRRCGVNPYAATRLLDVADGLRPNDSVSYPVTVKRGD